MLAIFAIGRMNLSSHVEAPAEGSWSRHQQAEGSWCHPHWRAEEPWSFHQQRAVEGNAFYYLQIINLSYQLNSVWTFLAPTDMSNQGNR
jgi:hypothetical protein